MVRASKERHFEKDSNLKGNITNLNKKFFIKYYIIKKSFRSKMYLFMVLANIIFVALHFEVHPAVRLNTSKALTSM